MAYIFSTPAGLLVLFALGIEAVIGLILAASNGLAETHKDILVGFSVGFPILILLILMRLQRRSGVTSPEES